MNRKFSTLLAGVALMSAFTLNAAEVEPLSKASDAIAITTASQINANAYYYLTDGTNYLTVGTVDGKAVLTATNETPKLLEDMTNVSEYDMTLWSITAGAKDPASGTATYVFTNKATGAILNIAKKTSDKEPNAFLVDGTAEWAWTVDGAGAAISHAGKGLAIKINADGKVSIVGATDASTSIMAKKSATYYLNTTALNSFYGNRFALQFANNIDGNPFTSYELLAENAMELDGSTYGNDVYVSLKALNAPGKTKKDGKINNNVYVSVDTTLYTRSGIQTIDGRTGIGYKLTTDTLVHNVQPGTGKNWEQSLKPVYMYNFRFTYDPSATEAAGVLKVEVVTPVKKQGVNQTKESAFATVDDNGDITGYVNSWGASTQGQDVDKNYLSWAEFEGGNKYLSTSTKINGGIDNVSYPKITFKTGVLANIKEGAYYVVDAKEYKQIASELENPDKPGEYLLKWVANDAKGKAYIMTGCDAGTVNYAGAYADYLPATQWAVKGSKGKYALYNRGFANASDWKYTGNRYYDLGDGKYAVLNVDRTVGDKGIIITTDTVQLIPVEADKYIGYRHFTKEEVKNMVFGLQVSSDIATAFIGNSKDVLNLIKASTLEDGAQKFKLENVGETFELGFAEGDSLISNIYALKERFGTKYLALNEDGTGLVMRNLKSDKPENSAITYLEKPIAVSFKNATPEGDYKMFVMVPEVKETGASDYDYEMEIVFNTTGIATTKEEIAVIIGSSDEEKVDAYIKDYCHYVTSYTVLENNADIAIDKIAGSISNAKVSLIQTCDSKFDDRFKIVAEAMPEYAKVAQGHYNIRTEEDDTKALTMFSDGYAWLKTAGQQMGDTIVTEENLGMWIAEANVSDVTKPLYYITTARGISAENQEAGLKFHMSATTEKTYADKNRLNFVEATALGDSAIVFAAAPKDSLKLSTVKAGKVVFAFETTPTAGEYLMVVPGLTKKVDTDEKDPWTGKPIQIDGEDTDNYVAVYNNILFLTNKEEAYKFTLNATSKSPVSNEGAAVSSISVSAENGQVTILNATGKKVSITNTLGQTLVNTAITSDRASYGVQSGIVYVQVEGEAAVSVIVK